MATVGNKKDKKEEESYHPAAFVRLTHKICCNIASCIKGWRRKSCGRDVNLL